MTVQAEDPPTDMNARTAVVSWKLPSRVRGIEGQLRGDFGYSTSDRVGQRSTVDMTVQFVGNRYWQARNESGPPLKKLFASFGLHNGQALASGDTE